MAEINEKMTADRAKEILSAEFFINYSKDELLAAVETLRGDATQRDLITAFRRKYYASLNDETPDYNEYQTLMGIFEGTRYATELKRDAQKQAQHVADLIQKENHDFSFAELDYIQSLFRVVPQKDEVTAKLNEMIDAKMDELLQDKVALQIAELESAQRLVDNLDNEEKKAQVQEKLDEVLESYETENGLDQDVEVLRKNDKSLGDHLDSLQLYAEDGKVAEEFKDLAQMVDNLELVEDDGTTLGAEEKQKSLAQLFEAVKLEAHQENIGNIKYLMMSKKAQREQLAEKVKDLFVAKLGQAGIASTFEQPTVEEQQDDNKYKAYLERRIKAADEFATKLAKGGQKLKVKVNNIIMACADTDINVSRFAQRLEAKIGQGSSVLGQKLNSFRDKAVALWGNRYVIARNIVKNVKENKWEHITNYSASAMIWVAGMAAPALTLPAVGAYAVYSAAGNFWWPVVREARKQRAAAEKDGQKMGFWSSITKAWQIKKQDRSYRNRAGWGIVAGAAGAALGFGGFTMGLETVAARAEATLSRSLSSLAAQTMTYLGARADYKKDPSEENKRELRSAEYSLGIAAVGAGLSSYFSVNRLAAHTDWQSQAQMSTPLREGWGELPAEDVPAQEAVIPSVEDSLFPEQYNVDMGITQGQYNNLLKLYSTEDLDRMYYNLSATGVMEHMDGMTKEEFIFKWSKLDAYTDRVRWDENAQQYISIQGAKRYHFEKEMTDLNKLLNCGDKLEADQIEKIKAALGTIDDRGGYHGPGYVPTENYHVKGAGVDGPCSEGQENHFNRGGKASPRIVKVERVPEPEITPEPEKTPLDLTVEYGEPQTDYTYVPEMQEVTEKLEHANIEVSWPHGQHAVLNDISEVRAENGDIMWVDKNGVTKIHIPAGSKTAEIFWGNGCSSEKISTTCLRKRIIDVESVSTKVPVEYKPYSAYDVTKAANRYGCKADELTLTSRFNGVDQYRMVTKDGVVSVRVGTDRVPHYSMENFDGKKTSAVPPEIVKEHFHNADTQLRNGSYSSLPAKTTVAQKILAGRSGLGK